MRSFASRTSISFASIAFALWATGLCPAQQGAKQALGAPRISWSFDAAHNAIHASAPAPAMVAGTREWAPVAETAATSTTYTGTIVVNFTMNLLSGVPKNAVVRCSTDVLLQYTVEEKISTNITEIGGYIMETTAAGDATISGSTATCKFTVPYSWTVPASTSTSTVTVQGINGSAFAEETVADTSGGQSAVIVLHGNGGFLNAPASIPADGTTTTLEISTVL